MTVNRPSEQPSWRLRRKGNAVSVAALVAVLGLVATGVGVLLAADAARADARRETSTRLAVVGDSLDRQVLRYAETLNGLRAAFALDPGLDRARFHQLVDLDALTRRNPGAQAISFHRVVPDGQLEAYERQVRLSYPEFRVHPTVKASQHLVVEFVEPPEGNEEAFGFDVVSDPVRLAALDFARDTGELAATAPLTLLQQDASVGFLLVLAAYDVAPAPLTAPSRRRHHLGAVVAVFGAEQMVTHALATSPGLGVAIFDAGATVDAPRVSPRPQDWLVGPPRSGGQFFDVNVGTRRWRLVASHTLPADKVASVAVGVSGAAVTMLVAGVIAAMAGGRRRALSLATSMTADLRSSQESLRVANEELREADRLKDVFLTTVSHELRTPLTAIAGVSDLLSRRSDRIDLVLREQLVGMLGDNVRNLRGLIDELLDFTRMQAETAPPDLESVDLPGLVHRVTRDLAPVLAGHELEVQATEGVTALANEQALGRVLNNLLVNAAKYSPPGGVIRVTVGGDDGSAVVSVFDAGPGIELDERPRVFERFYRGSSDAVIRQTGTGIGLAVVKELCERMGATVTITDSDLGGAAFHVWLPVPPVS